MNLCKNMHVIFGFINMCICIKSELRKHMKNVSPVEMAMGIYDMYIYIYMHGM